MLELQDCAGAVGGGGVGNGAVVGGFPVCGCEGVGDAGAIGFGEGVVYGVVESLGELEDVTWLCV